MTDTTAAGTFELPGVTVGAFGTELDALADGRLAFIGSAGGKSGIWITDGTAAGTSQLVVPGANAAGLSPYNIMVLGSRIIFDGVTASGARSLFISDGTGAGTSLLSSDVSLAGYFGIVSASLPATDDRFFDGAGNQRYVGTGAHNTLSIAEGRRGDTFALQGDGSVAVGHAGQLDAVLNIQAVTFIDGRMVFDADDPAAAVTRLYQAALGRLPDQGGLHSWIGALQAGRPLADLAASFIASPEFTTRFGANLNNADFVTRIYQTTLARQPDGPGLAGWTGLLDSGGYSRGQVLAAISESAENRVNTAPLVAAGIWDLSEGAAQVARLYDTALGRLPEAGGLASWIAALNQGTSLLTVASAFVGSPEFALRYGAPDAAGFVDAMYRNALHRPGDADGIAGWTAALNSGMSRARVVVGFSESAEHEANTQPNIMNDDVANFGIKLG